MGSEMCIRDSLWRAGLWKRSFFTPSLLILGLTEVSVIVPAIGVKVMPVSSQGLFIWWLKLPGSHVPLDIVNVPAMTSIPLDASVPADLLIVTLFNVVALTVWAPLPSNITVDVPSVRVPAVSEKLPLTLTVLAPKSIEEFVTFNIKLVVIVNPPPRVRTWAFVPLAVFIVIDFTLITAGTETVAATRPSNTTSSVSSGTSFLSQFNLSAYEVPSPLPSHVTVAAKIKVGNKNKNIKINNRNVSNPVLFLMPFSQYVSL